MDALNFHANGDVAVDSIVHALSHKHTDSHPNGYADSISNRDVKQGRDCCISRW
jgi:hypothetical protein